MRDVTHKGTRDERGFSRKTNGLESNRAAVLKRLETVCRRQGGEKKMGWALFRSRSTAAPFREASHAKFFAYNP